MNRSIIWSVVGILAVCLTPRAFAVSFDSFGPIDHQNSPPDGNWTLRPAVSGDGSTVTASSGLAGFTWTRTGGKVLLPSWSSCIPRALSHDGTVVAGSALQNTGGWHAARWVEHEQHYIDPWFNPTGVSADGAVVVGRQPVNGGGYKWIQGAAWNIPPSQLTAAMGVSADGMIIAGNRISGGYVGGLWFPLVSSARIWNNWVVTELGSLTEGEYAESYTSGISPDGNVVFGYSTSERAREEGFRWTAETGMEGVGAVPGWGLDHYSWMLASNYDGSVLVGVAEPEMTLQPENERAVIWDARNGIRFLDDVLSNDFGLDLTGWQLSSASGISWDGTTIVGYGISPQGVHEGWIAVVPEPSCMVLIMAGLLSGVRRRRRNR